ncbi:protransforming growth factor alpha [Pteronotus mesoamericanus]|uniref:protransforming growth factor alpha n=1 Tax=Pteronotus mesoamericanus TaxID=1884717 RepID=UPI0023ECD351|nr:protransforming growth factor alpha [Pteronotus parnellii mesoamericanus]
MSEAGLQALIVGLWSPEQQELSSFETPAADGFDVKSALKPGHLIFQSALSADQTRAWRRRVQGPKPWEMGPGTHSQSSWAARRLDPVSWRLLLVRVTLRPGGARLAAALCGHFHLALGFLFVLTSETNPPMAAAVVSYFNECPDSHSQFCFHGTCRFLVQEDKPACVCHSGYIGARCEHADLLAVVAASQKKQAITALVVVSIVALAGLIITCVLIHCCQVRKHCEWCRALICRHEKPSALLKGRAACCHSETVV